MYCSLSAISFCKEKNGFTSRLLGARDDAKVKKT